MTGWIVAGALYVLGFVALNTMSRDFSTRPRHRTTIIGLVFWPFVVPLMLAADLSDAILSTKKHN